jgi:thiol-disulfide isomerase/thioredoxin
MKLLLPALALLGALSLPLSAQEPQEKRPVASTTEASAKTKPYKIGSTVDENLVLTDIDGKTVSFKELRNKVVLLHFWSVQCPSEVKADPKMVALEQRWASNKDVVVLAVNANNTEIGAELQRSDDPARPAYANIREHLKAKKMDFRVFVDHGNKLADLFDGKSTPHCFVIDQKGVLRYAGALDDDPQDEKGDAAKQYVRDAVEAVVAGKEPPTTETKPYGCSIKRVKAAAKP